LRATFDLYPVRISNVQDTISVIDGEGENRTMRAFQSDAKRATANGLDSRHVTPSKVERWKER